MKEVRKVLLKRVDELKKAYKDFENNPHEKETAHKLRVESRKLRSLLNFLKKTFDKDDYDEMNDDLKSLAQIYGPLREIDVLIEVCTEIALDAPDLSEHYKRMFDYLHQARTREMKKALKVTAKRSAEGKIEKVETNVESISFKSKDGEKIDWDGYIKKRLIRKNRRLTADYNRIDRGDYEAVHETRKKAKKLRYAARYFGKLTTLKHKKVQRNARKIQDEFGQYTDAHVNEQMMAEYADKTDDEDLKKLFNKMIEVQRGRAAE